MISWRNPDARHARLGPRHLRARRSSRRSTRSARSPRADSAHLFGACSGGILAVDGRRPPRRTPAGDDGSPALTLAVTRARPGAAPGTPAALVDERPRDGGHRTCPRGRGYLDGRTLAEVFAWLRPERPDLELLGQQLPAGQERRPPSTSCSGTPTPPGCRRAARGLRRARDGQHARHAGRGDRARHAGRPGQGHRRLLHRRRRHRPHHPVAGLLPQRPQLLGGDIRFVLSTSGHIAALVNPPGNPKASYQIATENPADPQAWLGTARHPRRQLVDGLRGLAGERGGDLPARHPTGSAAAASSRSPPRPAPTSTTSDNVREAMSMDTMDLSTLGAGLGTDYFLLARPAHPGAAGLPRRGPGPSSTTRCCRSSTATGSAPSSRWPLVRELGEPASSATASRATAARRWTRCPPGWSPWSSPAATAASAPSSACRPGWPCARSPCSAPRSRSSAGCRPMARLEKLGAFALTEPDHGSDSVALETAARRDGDSWVINGAKKWIGNGTIADVVVVWARDTADGKVKGFLVEKGTPGLRRHGDRGQGRRCARCGRPRSPSTTCASRRRTGCPARSRFKDTARVLAATRGACAWIALGHAVAGYEAALTYAAAAAAVRQAAGQLPDRAAAAGPDARRGHRDAALLPAARPTLRDRASSTTRSPRWPSCTTPRKARQVLAEARDLLGGNGILLDYHVCGTWPTSRRSTPTRAPRPCRR